MALWEPEYKGKIAVPDIATSHGAFFLLTAADMTGGNVKNIDPGFELIKKLKPNILTFYTQHAQLAQLFTQGDVAMSSWTSDRAQAAMDGGAPLGWTVPKEGAYIIDSTIGIAKGSKNTEAALKYVDFVLSEAAQAANAEHTYLAPVNRNVKLPRGGCGQASGQGSRAAEAGRLGLRDHRASAVDAAVDARDRRQLSCRT